MGDGVSVGEDTWTGTGIGVCVIEVGGGGVEVGDDGSSAETIGAVGDALIFCTINTPLVQNTQTTASARIAIIAHCRLVIVVFSQAVLVTPSGAKYLSKWIARYFAALSMTIVAFMQTKGIASRRYS